MKFSYLFILLLVLSFVFLGGFGALTYFIYDNSSSLQSLQTKKINKNAVYDRAIIDEKLPVNIGPQGPAGPAGDPSTREIILEINNLYPFDHFGKLPTQTPIILRFSTDFKNSAFANTTFSGWIIKTVNLEQELLGQIYHERDKKSLGSYQILTTKLKNKKVSNHITWEFIKLDPKYLKDAYMPKTDFDEKIATKADLANSYTKAQIGTKLLGKAAQSSTPNKLEINNRFKAIAPPSDAYSQVEIDAKLATKADKADTYTKTEIDAKINQKVDRWHLYSRKWSDTELAKKADQTYTYTKTEVDNQIKNRQTFNWTKFVKTGFSSGKTNTKVYGDTKFSSGAFRLNMLFLKMEPVFFKGDRLTIIGKIKSLYNGYQGLTIDFRNAANRVDVINISRLNHWNRWNDGGVVRTKNLSKVFNPTKDVNDYPLFAAKKTFKNYFSFRMEIVFANDYIFLYTYAFTNQQSNLDEMISIVVIDYPSGYNDAKGMTIESIDNVPLDYNTGLIPSTSGIDLLANGSELTFIRDIRNREFDEKTILTTIETSYT